MKKILIFLIFSTLLILTACKSDEKTNQTGDNNFIGHKVKVEEVIQTKTYTYLRVSENDKENWLATSSREAKVGEILYWTEALEMKNFESKDLKRTFETIYFIQNISDQPTPMMPKGHAENIQGRKPTIAKETLSIEPVKGSISIAELYQNPQQYSDKSIIVKGKVIKFNKEIMNKNWAHIQDGSSEGDNFDLTITTLENVKPGDILTFKGKITIDKDFGYGYSYKILMEDAVILDDKSI